MLRFLRRLKCLVGWHYWIYLDGPNVNGRWCFECGKIRPWPDTDEEVDEWLARCEKEKGDAD